MQGKTGTLSPELVQVTQYIEPVPLRRIWDKRLARLIDDGGCIGPLDEGVCCYFLSPPDECLEEAEDVFRRAIGRVWNLR